MMSEINDEGPAFPAAGMLGRGMTLRDYFAAKAMQGICAHHDTWGESMNGIATTSYQIADAMLAAREVTR